MNYELAYALGFHPWEKGGKDPVFVEQITALLDQEEERLGAPPFGSALDVGTGSGPWALHLAERGWKVTGVDIVEKALGRARRRLAESGMDGRVRFVRGDVADLRGAGLQPGFRLLLDTGTFHGLPDDSRAAMGREMTRVAAPDATLLMLAWEPRRRPWIPGVDRKGIRNAFPDWILAEVEPLRARLPGPLEWLMRPEARWYTLRRS